MILLVSVKVEDKRKMQKGFHRLKRTPLGEIKKNNHVGEQGRKRKKNLRLMRRER